MTARIVHEMTQPEMDAHDERILKERIDKLKYLFEQKPIVEEGYLSEFSEFDVAFIFAQLEKEQL